MNDIIGYIISIETLHTNPENNSAFSRHCDSFKVICRENFDDNPYLRVQNTFEYSGNSELPNHAEASNYVEDI